jgi:hypothetical protein
MFKKLNNNFVYEMMGNRESLKLTGLEPWFTHPS